MNTLKRHITDVKTDTTAGLFDLLRLKESRLMLQHTCQLIKESCPAGTTVVLCLTNAAVDDHAERRILTVAETQPYSGSIKFKASPKLSLPFYSILRNSLGGDAFELRKGNSFGSYELDIRNVTGYSAINLPIAGTTYSVLLLGLYHTNNIKSEQEATFKSAAALHLTELVEPIILAQRGIEIPAARIQLRDTLIHALSMRHIESHEHCNNVAALAETLRIIYERTLPDTLQDEKKLRDDLDKLDFAAPLHDISKMAIPRRILSKQGKLTEQEQTIMRSHAEMTYLILQSSSLLQEYSLLAAGHHI
jgi:hypothetical protein